MYLAEARAVAGLDHPHIVLVFDVGSHSELRDVSGYRTRSRDFEDLIRILDSEVRLITPTDPEGLEAEPPPSPAVAAGERYYQLTDRLSCSS